jgi:hypothetical protein
MGTKNSVIKYALFTALLVSAMTFMGCEFDGDYKSIPSELRGTWECTTEDWWPEGWYYTKAKGTLVITYNSVTINGPSQRLKNFTRDIAIEAYAEDGQLYIKDKGVWQDPVAYKRWQSKDIPNIAMLTLSGGDIAGGSIADETLKRIDD